MIVLYTGTPGSGKSLDIARQMAVKLSLGHNVIGNMTINPDKIAKRKGRYIYVDTYSLNPKELKDYAVKFHKKGVEGQTYIVIDECQRIFNSRDWQKSSMRAWNEFFQLHRHLGYHVYLITQYDRLIDRQLRALIEYNRIHRKISNAGTKGKIMSLLAGGKLFVCQEEWYPQHMATGHYFFKYKKKYGTWYDSYAAFDESIRPRNELRDILYPPLIEKKDESDDMAESSGASGDGVAQAGVPAPDAPEAVASLSDDPDGIIPLTSA